ncbi:MAG: T9SS C-terminal target domain-containing protein [Bacteroidetes bacterium]|nr:MAG: T9SS C-terminal target domain-containing protein [Bacteroidota bacterium]
MHFFHLKIYYMTKSLRFLLNSIAIIFIFTNANAQYTTPGNNLSLTFDDLVTLSGGVVTTSDGDYFVNNTLIISATDTLKIMQPETIRVAANIRIEVSGKFLSDPADGQVVFTAQDTTVTANNFRGFRFEDADTAIFRNTVVKYGGGIQLIGTEALFEYCVLRNNGDSNVSAAITYSNSSPFILNTEFRANANSAIASGANVTGSPHIINNTFIHNTMNNSNRPQVNLGPGASDTIYIVGNYVEGLNDNAGGIAISNFVGLGNTLAHVADNTIIANRYGYAQIGNNISSLIRDNIILDNDIQGNPGLGGSGLNFLGNTNNFSVVRNNLISGNLWGITIQNSALPDIGTEDDHGGNIIFENENDFYADQDAFIHSIANATSNIISAIGNYLGYNDIEQASNTLWPRPDEDGVTTILYDPIMTLHPEILSFSFTQALNPGLDEDYAGIFDEENQEIYFFFPAFTDVTELVPDIELPPGVSVTPGLGEAQDFTEPVLYIASVPHGEEVEWNVIVEAEEPETFTVTFSILDEEENELTDAAISFDGITNDAGDYVFEEVLPGTYEYIITLFGYHTVEGSLEVTDEDVFLTVIMELVTYTLTFVIKDVEGQDVTGAIIELNEVEYNPGQYIFENLLQGVYEYVIYAEDYQDFEGSIEITDADVELNIVLEFMVSVPEFAAGKLSIYPNPADSYFVLNMKGEGSADIMINDLTGRTVLQKTIENPTESIDVGHLPNGIYVVTLQAGNKAFVGKLNIIK